MKTNALLHELERIPLANTHPRYPLQDIAKEMSRIRGDRFVVEAAVGLEGVFSTIFRERNIPDDLQIAYQDAFPNVAADHSLLQRYSEMVERGPESAGSFVGTLKGKLFEVRLPELLNAQFPDYRFETAGDPTQPVWDIIGTSSSGETMLIQAKMGGSSYAPNVLAGMHENPDILFAASNEIRDSILSTNPELADRFVDIDISNFDFTTDIQHDLGLLAGNLGIELPDALGAIIPYGAEIVLGLQLVWELIAVQKDYKAISSHDKAKIAVVKALVLCSRFGVAAVFTTLGAALGTTAGSVVPAIGNAVGGVTGALTGACAAFIFNTVLRPQYLQIALAITGLTHDDIFYFRNKTVIDTIGASFVATSKYAHDGLMQNI